jgi:hypothetical protein
MQPELKAYVDYFINGIDKETLGQRLKQQEKKRTQIQFF